MRYHINEALGDFLLAVPGVSALIGSRLYPDNGPVNAQMPFALYSSNQSTADRTLNVGVLKSRTINYQITVSSRSKSQASQIAALWAARSQDGGIDGFRGVMGSGGSAANVFFAFVDDVSDETIEPQTAEETLFYTATLSVRIKFKT